MDIFILIELSSFFESNLRQLLIDLHQHYLVNNENDEGDLIYYRINYRLIDSFGISKDDAEKFHSEYHKDKPRKISEGYCHICQSIVKIIPIIYGFSEKEGISMILKQDEGRIILGTFDDIPKDYRLPMFGCKICKSPLPNLEPHSKEAEAIK